MQYPTNTTDGLLTTAQYLASEKTSFRVFSRTLFASIISASIVLTGIGVNHFWSVPPSTQPHEAVIVAQPMQKYTSGLLARAEKEVVEEPVTEPQPVVVVAAAKKAVAVVSLAPAQSLDEVISRWKAAHPGVQLGVMLKEFEGAGRQVSSGADQQFYAASLYKLYVTYYLYDRIERGDLDPASRLGSDRTVAECIDAMILVSDNTCPEGIANTVGWANIHAFIQSKGFNMTSLSGGITASAADTNEFMSRLYGGQLMDTAHTAHVIGLMKRQIYRSAIPAGIPGSTVANKVGFYGNSWHDAAIVYGPKGTYALSILTKGANAKLIADLSRQISSFMDQ